MNDALDFYKKEKIWHISGYNKFNYKDKTKYFMEINELLGLGYLGR